MIKLTRKPVPHLAISITILRKYLLCLVPKLYLNITLLVVFFVSGVVRFVVAGEFCFVLFFNIAVAITLVQIPIAITAKEGNLKLISNSYKSNPGEVKNSTYPFNRYNDKYTAPCLPFSHHSHYPFHRLIQLLSKQSRLDVITDATGTISESGSLGHKPSCRLLLSKDHDVTLLFALTSTKSQTKLKCSDFNKDTECLNKSYYCQLQHVRLDIQHISCISIPKKEENSNDEWLLNSSRRPEKEVVGETKALISRAIKIPLKVYVPCS